MPANLRTKKIAFLTANSGVEQVELTRPWQDLEQAGTDPVLIAPEDGTVQAFDHDVERADEFPVGTTLSEAREADFAALVLPGGTTNADRLRLVPAAVSFVRSFVEAHKPVGAICHGPWALVEADVVRGKTMTSFPSLQTDIRNAGGSWVDAQVFVCTADSWTLVTSRNPGDLDAFGPTLVTEFA